MCKKNEYVLSKYNKFPSSTNNNYFTGLFNSITQYYWVYFSFKILLV